MKRSVGSVELPGARGNLDNVPMVEACDDTGGAVVGHEHDVVTGSEEFGQNRAFQLRQESMSWMKDHMGRLNRAGQLIVGLCAGTSSMTKALNQVSKTLTVC